MTMLQAACVALACTCGGIIFGFFVGHMVGRDDGIDEGMEIARNKERWSM